MKVLAALLGMSVLLNAALIARGPSTPAEPARRPAPPHPRPAAAPATYPDPVEVAVLRERVRSLETEKVARTEAVALPDRLAAFREKLPRVLRRVIEGRPLGAAGPENQLELSEVTVAFQRAKVDRWKDPKAYVETLELVFEQVAAETKAPLRDDQKAELRRTLEEYETVLSGMADKDAFDRYRREAGPEAEVLRKLRAFMSPEQENRVSIFGGMSPFTPTFMTHWVDRGQAETQAVQLWMSAYGLDESQRAAAKAAARLYVSACDALNTQLGRDAVPGRESPDWRRRTAEILLDSLGSLESSLTPEQRARLRSQRPAELRVFDPAAVQRYAR